MRRFAIIATGLWLNGFCWSAPQVGQPWTAPSNGIEFVWVESANLWAGKYEVTNADFQALREHHNSGSVLNRALSKPRQPVVHVSFEDAVAFATWLTENERNQGHIGEDQFYRLPQPSEWQAMAGCADGRTYPWGNAWPPEGANCADASSPVPHPLNVVQYNDGHPVTSLVEESEGNELGIHGMGGNVAEWVTEWYSGKRRRRSIRGGSWRQNKPANLECAYRNGYKPDFRTDSIGFRLVLGGPPPLDIDPRIVAAVLGGFVVIFGVFWGFRRIKIRPRIPEEPDPTPTPAAATPPARELAAFAQAPRQTTRHKSKSEVVGVSPPSPPPAPPSAPAPAPPPRPRPATGSESTPGIRLATSMDENQERDKSIVASILEIRSQAQASRDSGKEKPPKIPKKGK